MSYPIRALPLETRPRERLLLEGEAALSLPELIAIILGSGTKGKSVLELAQELVVRFGSLESLVDASLEELMETKGVGRAKALQLHAVFAIAKRAQGKKAPFKQKVDSPSVAFHLAREEIGACKQEVLLVLLLDVRGRLQHKEKVAIGTLSQLLVHPREVFYPAIRHKADRLILVHNHPSGDLTPSREDLLVTKSLLAASRTVGIHFIDHLIISPFAYLSLREKGCLSDSLGY